MSAMMNSKSRRDADRSIAEAVGPMSMYRNIVENRYGDGERYEAALELLHASRALAASISDVLGRFSLTMSQWSVLAMVHLSPQGQMPLGLIARALAVHATTVTNAVDRLEELDFVERLGVRADRRTVLARLTDNGRDFADKVMVALAEDGFGLATVADDDVVALTTILRCYAPLPEK
jgi:DNA-binding MarR family transcriptional regulator